MERRSAKDNGHLNQQPPWSCYSFSLAGFSWPPQRPSSTSYTCGYCKREFRSAQALGGHMNVHRRERARLRQCLHNPNPSHRAPLPNLNLSPPYCASDGGATSTAGPVIYSFVSTTTSAAATKALEVNLELGIGVCSAGGGGGGGMEDGLDLELRLGCS